MSKIFDSVKLSLFVNLIKCLENENLNYKIVDDVIYIDEFTTITIKDKEVYAELVIQYANEIYAHEPIDIINYSIPKDGDKLFQILVRDLLDGLEEMKKSKRRSVVKNIVKQYKLKEIVNGVEYGDEQDIRLTIDTDRLEYITFSVNKTKGITNKVEINTLAINLEDIFSTIEDLLDISNI